MPNKLPFPYRLVMGLCFAIYSCCLIGAGFQIGSFVREPLAIYERKVEGDEREFLDLEVRAIERIRFVKSTTDTFKRLDEIQSDETEALMKKVKECDNPKLHLGYPYWKR